jgi:hypothetical protein
MGVGGWDTTRRREAVRDDGYKDDGLGDERVRITCNLLIDAREVLRGMQSAPSPSPVDPVFEDNVQRRASSIGYIDLALKVLVGGSAEEPKP